MTKMSIPMEDWLKRVVCVKHQVTYLLACLLTYCACLELVFRTVTGAL